MTTKPECPCTLTQEDLERIDVRPDGRCTAEYAEDILKRVTNPRICNKHFISHPTKTEKDLRIRDEFAVRLAQKQYQARRKNSFPAYQVTPSSGGGFLNVSSYLFWPFWGEPRHNYSEVSWKDPSLEPKKEK